MDELTAGKQALTQVELASRFTALAPLAPAGLIGVENTSFPKLWDMRGTPMIARHWRGWTSVHDADAYETLLKTKVLPDLKRIAGYCGGYVLRAEGEQEVEFVVINLFDSIESVRLFSGADNAAPVFEPEARMLLSRIEPIARHYEVRASSV